MATPNINYAPLTPVSNETNVRTERMTGLVHTPVATSRVNIDIEKMVIITLS
jgi:hypothetical protein